MWPARVVPPGIGLVCSTTDPEQAQVSPMPTLRSSPSEICRRNSPCRRRRPGRTTVRAGVAGTGAHCHRGGTAFTVVGPTRRGPLADLDGDDFASIAGDADQAAAIEAAADGPGHRAPADAEDVAGVFLGRVGERIGDYAAAVLLRALATVRSASRRVTSRH